MMALFPVGFQKRWPHLLVSASVCAAALMMGGCTSSNFVAYSRQETIDPKTDGQYKVTGYVHSRDWTTCFFVVLPVGEDIDDKSSSILKRPNEGDIGPVTLHTENYTINPAIAWAHYGGFLPYIIGTRCNYVSATYVKPTATGVQSASTK